MIGFVWPRELGSFRSWVAHDWTIVKPVTQRIYDRERGWRVLGIEFTIHDTRAGSVL